MNGVIDLAAIAVQKHIMICFRISAILAVVVGFVDAFQVHGRFTEPPLDQGIVHMGLTVKAHGIDQICSGSTGSDGHTQNTIGIPRPAAAAVICKRYQRIKFMLIECQLVLFCKVLDFIFKTQQHGPEQCLCLRFGNAIGAVLF